MKISNFILSLSILFAVACSNKNDYEISDFKSIINFDFKGDTLILPMDLSNAISEGIVIPSKQQCQTGYFKFSFKIRNNSGKAKNYYYKIFYQNDSYKFPEVTGSSYNEASRNNFYGSWENCIDTLHKTISIPADNQYYTIIDSFHIVGNPRDEHKFYGSKSQWVDLSENTVEKAMQSIINTPEWYKSIQEKAKVNNIEVEDQLFRDAVWVLRDDAQKGDINNRWKRNPRVGSYSFHLLVLPEENISILPETVKKINETKDGQFVNPFFTLNHDKKFLKKNKNKFVFLKSPNILKTSANLDLGSGIYVDLLKFKKPGVDKSSFYKNCNNTEELYNKAQFEQHFHHIDHNFSLNNIPVVSDVVGENYSQDEYYKNKSKFKKEELIHDYAKTTDCPCKTVNSDSVNNSLTIKNPGNDYNSFRKENVGVTSRIGFTYGKFIARIKFPAIINKENVSNGLTCAYWLLYQEDNGWNTRSNCENLGYIPKEINGETNVRVKNTSYSEIDFEILKGSEHWPEYCYKGFLKAPKDEPSKNNNIIVTCTNWDLACRNPENFTTLAKTFKHDGQEYIIHRWDEWYKALSLKTPECHDSLFAQPYYYEIDWEPGRITWRIGKTLDNMRVVGYMDNTITTVPDNQMVMVFSQEFHYAAWWPLSPFEQDNIPYPKKDIVGEILEIIIE